MILSSKISVKGGILIKSAESTSKKSEKNHPLKNRPFFAAPRTVSMRTDISDALYRLLTILYGSWGNDGHLEFKIDTLCKLMGGKAYSTVKRIIAQGRKLELFETTLTGRSICFELIDSSNLTIKNELSESSNSIPQIAQKRAVSYKEQKKLLKTKQQGPAPVGAAAVALKNLRAKIDPIISRNIRDDALSQLLKIPDEQIKAASMEAMRSSVKNKAGLFIKLAKEPQENTSIKPVEIPENAPQGQINCIKCYNANCEKSNPTCETINPSKKVRNHPGGLCMQYCPFVLSNIELFK